MLLIAWKHGAWSRHRNNKDYLLYFQGFRDSGAMFQYRNNSLNHSTYLALFRTYLVTILMTLVSFWIVINISFVRGRSQTTFTNFANYWPPTYPCLHWLTFGLPPTYHYTCQHWHVINILLFSFDWTINGLFNDIMILSQ